MLVCSGILTVNSLTSKADVYIQCNANCTTHCRPLPAQCLFLCVPVLVQSYSSSRCKCSNDAPAMQTQGKVWCWYNLRSGVVEDIRLLFGRSRSLRVSGCCGTLVVSAAALVFVITILVVARTAEASLLVVVVSILVVAAAAKAVLAVLVIAVLVVTTPAEAQGLRARRECEGSHCDC
ncbi:hypothetical protein F4801DRAFT_288503 [Xylaria longipes]|nr:hypothetical protein F4801DRAFT_288503 [Xylaria longipes]